MERVIPLVSKMFMALMILIQCLAVAAAKWKPEIERRSDRRFFSIMMMRSMSPHT
jgi:hypothetical protein